MAQELNITTRYLKSVNGRVLVAGDDYNMGLDLEVANAATVVLTKAWLTIKEKTADGDVSAKLQLSSASASEIVVSAQPALNRVALILRFQSTGAKSTASLAGIWPYDLQLKAIVDGATRIMTALYGKIEFQPQVTQAVS